MDAPDRLGGVADRAGPGPIARTSVTGVAWPGIPDPVDGTVLSLLYQLDHSQWWPPDVMLGRQMRQLEGLLAHARRTVPFYRDRLAPLRGLQPGGLTPELWRRIPVLRRSDVQAAGQALVTRSLPEGHGRMADVSTSGSTGRPITVKNTAVMQLLFTAMNMRFHLWHGRDLSATVAAIQALSPDQAAAARERRARHWVAGYHGGPMYHFDVRNPVSEQLRWLRAVDPHYLLTHPSNLMALIARARETGTRLNRLAQVATLGELVTPRHRETCRSAWGVDLFDAYSSKELGMMALQCPGHAHYLVQAERVYLEVLDDRGEPCGPGTVGRIVATDLHNFASPLIRYEIGDHAEVGGPCPTGRGLPVLERILGRTRNMLMLPSGETMWPSFPARLFLDVVPVRQLQLVQRTREDIDVKLAMDDPLTPDQERRLREALRAKLGHPFHLTFTVVDEIPLGPGGKYEDFRSEVA